MGAQCRKTTRCAHFRGKEQTQRLFMKWIEDIRRFFRDLDYYSIKRPTTTWSRMLIRNLWVTLCLGFICAIAIQFLAKSSSPPFAWWEFFRNALLCWPFLYIGGLGVSGILYIWKITHSQHSQNVRKTLRTKGICPNCKYSLKGNPYAIRCPECGKHLFG